MVSSKWIFKKKHSWDDSIEKFKAMWHMMILLEGRDWLWRNFFTSSNIYFNQNYYFLGSQDEMEVTSNGCKDNFSKWCDIRRGIHWTTYRFWNPCQNFTCMKIEESIIWVEPSTQSMVWKKWWISDDLGIYQE